MDEAYRNIRSLKFFNDVGLIINQEESSSNKLVLINEEGEDLILWAENRPLQRPYIGVEKH